MAKKPMALKLADERVGEAGGAGRAPEPLLDAARQVFAERGYARAGFSDALRRAGADASYCGVSMDELYLNLWDDHHTAHMAAATAAVAAARQGGMTEPSELFAAGGRAFLQGSWHRRDLALFFSSGDAPPGFDAMRKRLRYAWLRRNAVLFRLDDSPEGRLYSVTLTSLIGRGGHEVAAAADFRQAQAMIDAVISYARLLVAERPRPISARHATLRA